MVRKIYKYNMRVKSMKIKEFINLFPNHPFSLFISQFPYLQEDSIWRWEVEEEVKKAEKWDEYKDAVTTAEEYLRKQKLQKDGKFLVATGERDGTGFQFFSEALSFASRNNLILVSHDRSGGGGHYSVIFLKKGKKVTEQELVEILNKYHIRNNRDRLEGELVEEKPEGCAGVIRVFKPKKLKINHPNFKYLKKILKNES